MRGASTITGTHFSLEHGQLHLAQACIAYLWASLDLVDQQLDERYIVTCLAQGFHVFNGYCFAHALRHLPLLDLRSAASLNASHYQEVRFQLCGRYEALDTRQQLVTTGASVDEAMRCVNQDLEAIAPSSGDGASGELFIILYAEKLLSKGHSSNAHCYELAIPR